MVRTNQGGSILGFVIVGSVLALLLIGGAYFVRHSLMPSDRNSGPVAQKNEADGEPDVDISDSNAPERSDDESAESHQDDSTTQQPAGDTSGQSAGDSIPTTGNTGEDELEPDALPQTGPTGAVLSGIMLGVLTALAIGYRRSRDLATSL